MMRFEFGKKKITRSVSQMDAFCSLCFIGEKQIFMKTNGKRTLWIYRTEMQVF